MVGTAPPGIGNLAARGAAYLAAREGIGAIVRLVGTILVIRMIGPSSYGVYSAAAAFVLFVALSAQMGAEVYLIRQPAEPTDRTYAAVLTFLVCSSLALTVLGIAASYVLAGFLHPAGVLLPLRILLLGVPVNVCWAPFQAKIERDFGYRKMGMLELGGDAVLYGTAVPLAFAGAGAWSLVVGYFTWQLFLLIGAISLSSLRPRLAWSPETMKSLLRHGVGYASTSWVLSLAGLANPLIVGRYAGASGVGFVSFAQRLVATVGFAARSAYRLGIVALSKISSSEKPRLRRAVEQASLLQLVALAVPLGGFAIIARFLIPALFGHAWTRAIPLFAMLALAAVLNAAGLIQTSVLLSRGQNVRVVCAALVQSAVFVAVLAATVPSLGVDGYGIATLAALADLVVIDLMTRREVSFGYRAMAPVAVALVPPVLAPLLPMGLGLLTVVPALVMLALPSQRRHLVETAQLGWSLLHRAAS